jgi:leucyl aminopeptidase
VPSYVAALPDFLLSDQEPRLGGAAPIALAVLDDDGEPALGPGSAAIADALDVDLLELGLTAGAAATPGAVTTLPLGTGVVLLVGAGDGGPDALRKAGAGLARAATGTTSLTSAVQAVGDADGLTAFVAGATLASFRFSMRSADDLPAPVRSITLALASPQTDQAVLDRALAIAHASAEARRLATTPSNIKSPAWLADEALALAAPGDLKTRVWDREALARDGFGGIVAVGRASATPPRLVRLEYRPGRRRAPHVVLVGKGITFDTGGLSIKPGEAMVNMKRDMTGAAVVAATLGSLHRVGCPVRVTGLLALAENAVGGDALRPGDVITHFGGRTTEVSNTDAEGRLVLADALRYAVDELEPDLLVDVATLTGAMKVALGLHTGGYFATDEAAAAHLERASAASGERMWRMPLSAEYESFLASKVADADNAPGRAPAITAALFLQHFTGGLPWMHLDIASVGDAATDKDEYTAGPTGFGVRLLLHWLGSEEPLAGIAR